jgi:hypothetical protein
VFGERKGTYRSSFRFAQPDGKAVWFSCNLSPVVSTRAGSTSPFSTPPKSPILKYAESALRESEAIYRQAIEAAGAVPYYQGASHTNTFRFMGAGIREILGIGQDGDYYRNYGIVPF